MPPLENIGPYRVVGFLGEGGMGVVYEARHTTIERRVAIKILHAEYARNSEVATRFLNEARAVNRIEHPGVVQVSDFGQLPDGVAYIVMEFLRGETLSARLKNQGGALGPQEAVYFCCQIADALAATHAQGIVHRDLKPANIMLIPDPQMLTGERTKILDFGIAKLTETLQPPQVKTRTNTVMGTPAYMSPEQCAGAGAVDDRSDVYSLGAMLFHMLAGRPPFDAEGSGVVMAMHLYETPPQIQTLLPSIPTTLAELVNSLLSKSRAERPSMREVHARLLALGRTMALPNTPYKAALAAIGSRTETAAGSTFGSTAAESKRLAQRRSLLLLATAGVAGAIGLGWLATTKLRPQALEPTPLPRAAAPANPAIGSIETASKQAPDQPIPANQAMPASPPTRKIEGERQPTSLPSRSPPRLDHIRVPKRRDAKGSVEKPGVSTQGKKGGVIDFGVVD